MTPALALAAELAAGALVADRLIARGGPPGGERLLWTLALAPLFGAGLASLLFVGHRALGLAPPGLALFAVESGLLAFLPALGVARAPALPRAAGRSAPPALQAGVALALLVAALLALRAAAAYWVEVPLGAWDAVATWNLRARLLHGCGADWVSALDATNYPLFLPGAIAAGWTWVGEEAMALPRGLGVAFCASAALLLPLAAGARARALGAAAAAILLTTPSFLTQGLAQEADLPVAALLLALLAVLGARLGGRAAPPPEAAGIALGLLAWTKNEGVLWALLAVGAYLLAGGRRALGDLLRLAAGAAPGLAAWALFKLLAAPAQGLSVASYLTGEWGGRLLAAERWRAVVAALANRFDPGRSGFGWGLAWTLVAAAALLGLLLGARRAGSAERAEQRFWALVVAGFLGALLPLYVLTPLPLEWHLGTSLDRLLLQLFPSALAAAASWLATGAAAPRLPDPESVGALSSRI